MSLKLFLIAVFIIVATLLYCDTIMRSRRNRKKIVYVPNNNLSQVVDTYNVYIHEIQEISNKFIETLNTKQRLVILAQDSYANQQNMYIVDEFNQTSEVLNYKLDEIKNAIDKNDASKANNLLQTLDKETSYLSSLIDLLLQVKINASSMTDTFRMTSDSTNNIQMTSYFSNCKTKQEAIERFRALAKVFHPDSKTGNEEMFQEIKNEFDEIIKNLV